ncbi:mechanosensitive ion channel family protein [Pontibacter rugosus]|uniref:Mechanosensitive ion channel family protein n=1 Tax=Pontibacter rugosus TaxID=1745966 RepID=A0ABW3ST03_9BACT
MSIANKPLTPTYSLLLFLLVLVNLTASALSAQAQLLPSDTSDSQEVLAPQWAEDSLGRRTPRGTVDGFIKAVAAEDYSKAAHYLNIEKKPRGAKQDGAILAQALQRLLDQRGNIMPYSWISNETSGLAGDNLGPNLDRVGTATYQGETFDLFVEKTEGPEGEPIWQFSSETIQRVPLEPEKVEDLPLTDRLLPTYLKENKWGGVPIGHWLAMVMLAALAYLIAWCITALIMFITRSLWRKAGEEHVTGILKAFALPTRLYLTIWILVASSREAGISIIVRQQFSELNIIILLVALLLLLWRLVDFITRFSEKRLTRRGNSAGISIVLFLRRSAKIAIVVFGIIAILSTFGFDVTTGLAALGIGGIALALGAQKTVENFVGSVTLIADQPIRVGDFCKVGDTVGTVEQIGMRSTRIRTNDRTIVTIPNGEFSSLKIENYTHRDRFWFHPVLGLRYETTPGQIRSILAELKALLLAHPKVSPDPARVRFVELGADSLKLEFFAYVLAKDYNEFLEIQEELILSIMDVIEEAGSGFAFPSQTLYLTRDKGIEKAQTQEAENTELNRSEEDAR